MGKRVSDQGFTLVEVLAALAVFSVAAIGLSQASGETVRGTRHIEAKSLAAIVAENQLAEALLAPGRLPDGVLSGQAVQMGRSFDWTRLVGPSPRADLQSVRLTVTDPATGQVLAESELFRRAGP